MRNIYRLLMYHINATPGLKSLNISFIPILGQTRIEL